MDQRIELKPFIAKDGQKYKIIEITDIALHTSLKRTTLSHGKKLEKAFRDMEPGRIYSPVEGNVVMKNEAFDINLLMMDEDFVRMVQEEEAKGFKILLGFPKTGVPIVSGSDTEEFLKSKNGKRISRGLAKEKRTS